MTTAVASPAPATTVRLRVPPPRDCPGRPRGGRHQRLRTHLASLRSVRTRLQQPHVGRRRDVVPCGAPGCCRTGQLLSTKCASSSASPVPSSIDPKPITSVLSGGLRGTGTAPTWPGVPGPNTLADYAVHRLEVCFELKLSSLILQKVIILYLVGARRDEVCSREGGQEVVQRLLVRQVDDVKPNFVALCAAGCPPIPRSNRCRGPEQVDVVAASSAGMLSQSGRTRRRLALVGCVARVARPSSAGSCTCW